VDGRYCSLGSFGTAVEAAAAYARAVAEAPEDAAAEEGEEAEEEEEGEEGAEPAPVVEEAEGLRLHLSNSNSTGYRGVRMQRGRFNARHMLDGTCLYLGSFGTAVEAAVAYARAVGQGGAEEGEGEGEGEEEGEEEEEMKEAEEGEGLSWLEPLGTRPLKAMCKARWAASCYGFG